MPLREVVTIEPCEHGRYDKHRVFGYEEIVRCLGGRILTNPQALRTLLFDVCEECEGRGVVDWGIDEDYPEHVDCPTCGGSGRTPKDGVWRVEHSKWARPELHEATGEFVFVIPASMLEGESE
jgi:hypothetical protein